MKLEDLALKLIAFDTQNSGDDPKLGGETLPLINFCARELEKQENVIVEVLPYDIPEKDNPKKIFRSNRANLFARLAAADPAKPTILLQGHVDTVLFGSPEKWKHNPLGEQKKDFIYGRGAADMKGPVAAMMHAFVELARHQDLKYNPALLLTSDEEANSFAGLNAFLEFMKRNPRKIDYGICGDGESFLICTRFKGAINYRISFSGKSCHSAVFWKGENAIYNALPTLNNLHKLVGEINKIENPLFESDDTHSKHATMNIGKVAGGIKANIVPDQCDIAFDIRTVSEKANYLSLIEKKVLNKIPSTIKYVSKFSFAFDPQIVPDRAYIHDLEAAARRHKTTKRGVVFGFTEATLLNSNNIPTIVFGCGESDKFHAVDELISIKDLRLFENILIDFFIK